MNITRIHMHLTLGLSVAALSLTPALCSAAQFVTTEVRYIHSAASTSDSHLRLAPSGQTPINWRSPVDYTAGGMAHVRLEVFTKPSAAPTRFQICFEANAGSYACTDQAPVYSKPGVYTWATPMPNFYQFSTVDWSKGVAKVALILKDDKNVKPAPENVGAATSAMYMPTDLRVTVTIVSPGSTYMPPADPQDAGAPDAAVFDSSAPDARASDAAPNAAMDASRVEPTAVSDAGDASASSAQAPSNAEDSSGCMQAGTIGDASAGAWLPFLALGLVCARRKSYCTGKSRQEHHR
jgi:hypothetical protein